MRNYLAACTHVYLVACSRMHAYLVGLEALDLISVTLSLPVYTHRLSSLCAHGHNNGTEVCVSSECPCETAKLV